MRIPKPLAVLALIVMLPAAVVHDLLFPRRPWISREA